MIRFTLRFLGFILTAAGFVALVIDGTRSIAGGRLIYTVVGETWRAIHLESFQLAKPAVERLSPWLWDPVALTALLAPTAAVTLVLGALLMLAGRKRAPRIGTIGRR